jgi:hypothetical protein
MLSITNEKTTYIPLHSPVPVKPETQSPTVQLPDTYHLGMFATAQFQTYSEEEALKLSDGSVIQKGDVAGVIDLMEEVDVLQMLPSEEARTLLVDDYKKALEDLAADLTKRNDLRSVRGFTILSHLFSREETIALGFDVIEIEDQTLREQAAEIGTIFTMARHREYDRAEVFRRKLEKVHIGWISAKHLIELYGEKKQEEKIA